MTVTIKNRKVTVKGPRGVLSRDMSHLRVDLQSAAGGKLQAIAFRVVDTPLGDFLGRSRGQTIHLAGQIQANYWNGGRSVQFRINDAAQVSTV